MSEAVALKTQVRLSMVIADDAKAMARCLASVKRLLDSWILVDVGASDATKTAALLALEGVPGEVHVRAGGDRARGRNEALVIARARAGPEDYLMVLEASDEVSFPPDFELPLLTHDAYEISAGEASDAARSRVFLLRARLDFRYVGAHHAALYAPPGVTRGRLTAAIYDSPDRPRAAKRELLDAASILEAALAREPANARYAFYLAQTLRDAGEPERAACAYAHRATMGGSEEEVYASLFEIAALSARLGKDSRRTVDAYLRAYEHRPTRAEPLCAIATHLREAGRAAAAYPFARTAIVLDRPHDVLFVDESVYEWRALDEFALAAYWSGKYDEALGANERLLAGSALPKWERERVKTNLAYCVDKTRGEREPGKEQG